MSTDTAQTTTTNNGEMYTRNRRGSITQAALTNLFQRGNSVPNGSGFPSQSSGPVDTGRRRLSVTTLGLSGTSPTNTSSFIRRGSMSTNSNNSDSIDENAIEDDDAFFGSAKTAPTTPFVPRMSFGTSNMRNIRPNGSPGNDQQGFNWSEQLRSRAESSVTGARPSFSLASTSPPRGNSIHDRAKSVSEMPQPPVQAASVKHQPKQPERPKPDAFQERILKGDFYMD
ncbi:hypothetical protein CDV36_008748 [Fusarium kuroshium]|uniref:Uncharacterized protein n=1 Tax=Fusarium kuroshium TaxID=2010991 RepID=A0A3M2S279_9HYPO|nr:hypothetical protein CDV36_008748 [Fusarium kuroshium]